MPPRKTKTESEQGEIENGLRKLGFGTSSFRIVVLLLVLSMHPLGRQILYTVGFEFPDQKKIVQAATAAETLQSDVKDLTKTVNDIQHKVNIMQTDNLVLATKVDNLEKNFSGFQIDFAKYRDKLK